MMKLKIEVLNFNFLKKYFRTLLQKILGGMETWCPVFVEP
jgi:hypothetical protein